MPPGAVCKQRLLSAGLQNTYLHAQVAAILQAPGQGRGDQQGCPVQSACAGLDYQWSQGGVTPPGPDDAVDTSRRGGADDHAKGLRIADAVKGEQAPGRIDAGEVPQVIGQGPEVRAQDVQRDALVLFAVL